MDNEGMSLNSQDNLTFKEVAEKIHQLYSSEEFCHLNAKKEKPYLLDAIGKSRSETVFSSLLAWTLNNKDFCNLSEPPIMWLLRLLARKSIQQAAADKDLMNSEISTAILTNELDVVTKCVATEVPTSIKDGKKKKTGKVDLVILCEVLGTDNKTIRIIIENKIDHIETEEQCNKYYQYFKSTPEIIFNEKSYKSDEDVFVFLSIEEPEKLSNNNYICITHQDIYDHVLKPLSKYKHGISEISIRYLNEYMDALTSLDTKGKTQIAMDKETRNLLKKFYESNQDIIDAAVMAGSNDEKVVDAVKDKRKSASKRYEIRYNDELIATTNQAHLLRDLVKDYLERNVGSDKSDIEDRLPWKIFDDGDTTGYDDIIINNVPYRVSNQKVRYDDNYRKIVKVFRNWGYDIKQY